MALLKYFSKIDKTKQNSGSSPGQSDRDDIDGITYGSYAFLEPVERDTSFCTADDEEQPPVSKCPRTDLDSHRTPITQCERELMESNILFTAVPGISLYQFSDIRKSSESVKSKFLNTRFQLDTHWKAPS